MKMERGISNAAFKNFQIMISLLPILQFPGRSHLLKKSCYRHLLIASNPNPCQPLESSKTVGNSQSWMLDALNEIEKKKCMNNLFCRRRFGFLRILRARVSKVFGEKLGFVHGIPLWVKEARVLVAMEVFDRERTYRFFYFYFYLL